MVDATQLAQFFVNGLVFGAILAVGAIGLTLVYGILNLSNFAHGDFLTFGAMMAVLFGSARLLLDSVMLAALVAAAVLAAWVLADSVAIRRLRRVERLGIVAFAVLLAASALLFARDPSRASDGIIFVATLISIVATVALVVGLELVVWRPLRRRRATLLTLVITSIGISLVVRNGLQQYFGGGNRFFTRPTAVADDFGGILISDAQQLTLLAALVIIGALHLFLTRTRTGKAMRALADNFDLARVTGIEVERVVIYVWIISGTLVAIAGVLLTLVTNNSINVNTGFFLIIPLFASVILGGIGSPYGAMAGGIVVGVAMKTSVLWLGTKYELAAAFVILILVLLVRPQGILGRKA